MKHNLHGTQIHLATGGRDFDPAGDVLVMLHGSGQNHLSWILQSRYFAHQGYSVLVPDFPGHGLSEGAPLETIEDMAAWVIDLLDSLGVKTACLVGHSQGCLVTIEAGARYPDRISHLVLIAGAMAIPVNEVLLDMSEQALEKAIAMLTSFGHGSEAHKYDHSLPGHSFIGFGERLMAVNNRDALKADFTACNSYSNGSAAAAKIGQPTLCLLAQKDRNTPIKFGKMMAEAIDDCTVAIMNNAGHMLPVERPLEVNAAMRDFLANR
jgi:pimeloyl-ACP methyl ester carboxylesterase